MGCTRHINNGVCIYRNAISDLGDGQGLTLFLRLSFNSGDEARQGRCIKVYNVGALRCSHLAH